MTLLDKIQQYIHLRKYNIRSSWTKSKLTDSDYWLITMIVCVILIVVTLYYADSIDKSLTEHQNQAIRAKNALHEANLTVNKQELIIISMLNGSVIENGRIKTMCVLNAAGDCR